MKRKLGRHKEKAKAKTIYAALFDFESKKTSWYSIAVDYSYPLKNKKLRKRKLLRVVREPTPPEPEVMKMDNWGSYCSFCVLGSKIYAIGDESTKVKVFDLNNITEGWMELPWFLQTPRFVPDLVSLHGKIYIFGGLDCIFLVRDVVGGSKPYAEVLDPEDVHKPTKALPNPPVFPCRARGNFTGDMGDGDFHHMYPKPNGYFGSNDVFVASLEDRGHILLTSKATYCYDYKLNFNPVSVAFTESKSESEASGTWCTVDWKGVVNRKYDVSDEEEFHKDERLYFRKHTKWNTFALEQADVRFETPENVLNGGAAVVGTTFYWYKPKTYQVMAYDYDNGIWYISRALVGNVVVEGTPILLGHEWNPILVHVHGADTFCLLWGFLGLLGALTFRAVKVAPRNRTSCFGYLKVSRISSKAYNIGQCQTLQAALLAPTSE